MPNYFSDYETIVNFISEEELKANHSAMPHGGYVLRSGVTGEGTTQVMEFSLKLGSNPEFTASVLVAYARAAHKLAVRGEAGARTVFDIPFGLLSPKSPEQLRKENAVRSSAIFDRHQRKPSLACVFCRVPMISLSKLLCSISHRFRVLVRLMPLTLLCYGSETLCSISPCSLVQLMNRLAAYLRVPCAAVAGRCGPLQAVAVAGRYSRFGSLRALLEATSGPAEAAAGRFGPSSLSGWDNDQKELDTLLNGRGKGLCLPYGAG